MKRNKLKKKQTKILQGVKEESKTGKIKKVFMGEG